MERVFKALADPTRRELLDELFRRDGQSLNALASRFAMTRVAVAKHLRLLEEAGLVASERRGREKLHFLNPVPIRSIHDRWVSKYTETWAAGLVDLKRHLEARVEKVFEIFICTTPQRLWQAITDPETRARFQFGARVESDWTTGSAYRVTHGGAGGLIEGENLEVDPPRRLVQTYHAIWDDDIAAQGTSRVTWQIEQVGDSCRL
ncbi:MAG TPA: metalloregulator ArsR/SmtB family transcription factor, partial [Mycobacteriales bacterium]|nr:metalloregulator ArsR/SmtB family transcription factor [Mycobacteriales bacterium]